MEKSSNVLIREQLTIRRMHYLMGTFVEIEAVGEERRQITEAVEAAFSEIKLAEYSLSRYLKESQISRINQYSHLFPVEINLEVFQLFEEAIRFSQSTNGAFDITIGAILELFNLTEERGCPPTDEEVRQACSGVGYADIVLDRRNKTIFFKKRGMKIDLGGIGKGYAIDRAIDVLKKEGIKKALVNAGGNIFCLDENSSPIGIKNPLKTDEVIASVLFKDKAISTSANYERSFSIDGKNYGHLVNPKTGYPVNNGVLSVSVISSKALMADILSTAVFILGLDEGMQLIESINDVEGIIITKDGRRARLCTSLGLKEVAHSTYLLN